MPIHSCTLPSGGTGFKWGSEGKCYQDRADAERQASAAFANGWKGDEAPLAFDRASVRTVDVDGRMHVEITPISKAGVNGYRGNEIPNGLELGLDPYKIYMLFRSPEELTRAAPSFRNLPLLSKHIRATAKEPQKDVIVGSTGSTCEFKAPFLKNSLAIWDAVAIAGVVTGEVCQLSASYHYKAAMTPGEYKGEKYDGVMTGIIGNHVALVEKGRAGPDVVVGDEAMPTEHDKSNGQFTSGGGGSVSPGGEKKARKPSPASIAKSAREKAEAEEDARHAAANEEHMKKSLSKAYEGGKPNTTVVKPEPKKNDKGEIDHTDAINKLAGHHMFNATSKRTMLKHYIDGKHGSDDASKKLAQEHHDKLGSDALMPGQFQGANDSAIQLVKELPNMPALSRKALFASGALCAYLQPKLANDQAIDLNPVLTGVTAKNFTAKQPDIIKALATATKGKLAHDADLDSIVDLLNAVGGTDTGPEPDPVTGDSNDLSFLEGKISPEDMSKLCELMGTKTNNPTPPVAVAADETDEQKAAREAAEKEKNGVPEAITKQAMDAAIEASNTKAVNDTVARMNGIREAEKAVRPIVGELNLAFDSAEGVYKYVLEAKGQKVDGIHPSAFKAMVGMLSKAGAPKKDPVVAMDAAGAESFAKRYPGQARIRNI